MGAVVALLHDVLVAVGVYCVMGNQLTVNMVAALLTIIGYSVNDTIVIFDRVPANMKMSPGKSFAEVANDSIDRREPDHPDLLRHHAQRRGAAVLRRWLDPGLFAAAVHRHDLGRVLHNLRGRADRADLASRHPPPRCSQARAGAGPRLRFRHGAGRARVAGGG